MKRLAIGLFCCAFVWSAATPAHAIKLLGVTGNQGLPNDETIFSMELSGANAGQPTQVQAMTPKYDGEALGDHPITGLVYRASGPEQYRDDPAQFAFQDNQFMETYNLKSGALHAVFDAAGILAPQPAWVLPQGVRQPGDPRGKGVDEYHEMRGLAWWGQEGKFLISDEDGIFSMTTDGISKFVGAPDSADPKGIAFVTVNNERRLVLTEKESLNLWTIDPTTGKEIGQAIAMTSNTPFQFSGVVALAENPLDGVLYGVGKIVGSDTDRELITIDPSTGVITDVGAIGIHIASIAFVPEKILTGDMNGDGAVNNLDIAPFAQALTDAAAFASSNPDVWILNGDINADGVLNNLDIAPFAALLVGGGSSAVPEPSTLVLAGLGLVALVVRKLAGRRRTAA